MNDNNTIDERFAHSERTCKAQLANYAQHLAFAASAHDHSRAAQIESMSHGFEHAFDTFAFAKRDTFVEFDPARSIELCRAYIAAAQRSRDIYARSHSWLAAMRTDAEIEGHEQLIQLAIDVFFLHALPHGRRDG